MLWRTRALAAALSLLVPFTAGVAEAQVKLSAINNGGNINLATDQCVAVRSGTTDELVSLAALATTVSGQTCTLGSACTIAFSGLSGQATNAQLATQTANTVLGALTATTPSGLALPSCTDSSGNHLNYTSGTGFSCGTSDSHVGTVTSVTFTGDGTVESSTPSSAVTTSGTVTATLANAAAGTVLGNATASAAAPTYTATPVLGKSGTGGTLGLANGSASGTTITLQNLGNITTGYNWNFPITAGAVGAIETSGGGGSTSNVWLSDVATGQILTSGGTGTIPAYSGTLPFTLPIAQGGTGQTTANPAFNALSPMTTGGDLIYGGASGAGTRLANGAAGFLLQANGTTAAETWVTALANGFTATTQAANDNSTKVATTAYVATAVGTPVTSFTGDNVIIGNSGSTGAVTDTLKTQNANTIFAGPTSGSAATPTMRAMVVADEPAFTKAIQTSFAMNSFGGL